MSQTQSTFLLVEAVNIDDGLLDTDQLSVIRGSSFLLKEAITKVAGAFAQEIEPISTGASSGLFRLKSEGGGDAAAMAERIACFLRDPARFYRLFTLLVEWCEAGDIRDARERLLAKLRFRQLRAVSSAPDDLSQASGKGACQLEGTRVQGRDSTQTLGDAQRTLSASVAIRLKHGQDARGSYYQRELARLGDGASIPHLDDVVFAQDFHALADDSRFSRLDGKIAVLYVDGNGFGKLQRDFIGQALQGLAEDARLEAGIRAQHTFDEQIKELRACFLRDLLSGLLSGGTADGRFLHGVADLPEHQGRLLRLETLLWGGDELLFVVPAWIGMDLLQHFFAVAADWSIGKMPLTHAAGLVYCGVKTPIRNIQALARQLAESVKDRCGRKHNAFDFMVLESVDYPTEPTLDESLRRRYGETLALIRPPGLCPVADWAHLKQGLAGLLEEQQGIARRQVFRIVQSLARDRDGALFGEHGELNAWTHVTGDQPVQKLSGLAQLERRLLTTAEHRQVLQEQLEYAFQFFRIADRDDPCARAWMWVNLVELWDYLVPDLKPTGQEAGT